MYCGIRFVRNREPSHQTEQDNLPFKDKTEVLAQGWIVEGTYLRLSSDLSASIKQV